MNVLQKRFPKIVRKTLEPGKSYVLRNLLSAQECQEIIRFAENMKFSYAGLAIGKDQYIIADKTRNNSRVLVEDQGFVDQIWQRIKHSVDQKYKNCEAIGLNPRLRIYKYEKNQQFAPHQDHVLHLPNTTHRTLFSFMIYLNESFQGGETTFFAPRSKGKKRNQVTKVVKPTVGKALVFDHELFHEGSIVKKGIKYALRSDLVYQPKNSSKPLP